MLNYIWAFMILIGVVFGALTGNMEEVSKAALDSAGEAVTLCITMIGVMALWVGLMEIAQKSGLIAKMTKGISPFISFLFPKIPKNHPAREYISTGGGTNGGRQAKSGLPVAGMGKKERSASKEMCNFLILNISSLQLIPVNMIVYRQQYGSVNPTAVIAPAIVATFFSTLAAVVFCKVMDWKRRA